MSSAKAGFDTPTWSCKPMQAPNLETSKLPKDPKLEAQGAPRLQLDGPTPRQCSISKTQSLQKSPDGGPKRPNSRFRKPKALQRSELGSPKRSKALVWGPKAFPRLIADAQRNSKSPAWRQKALARPHLCGKPSSEELNFDD